MTDQRTAPPYTEEQATRWLAWLAYNMRRRDMSIFQIESLQPDWLNGFFETLLHLLLTRMLWGMWAGLILGLSFGLIIESIALSIYGLFGGLAVGLTELVTPINKLDLFMRAQNNPSKSLIIGSLVFGLIGGSIFGLLGGLLPWVDEYELVLGSVIGLIIGLIIGFMRTSRVTLRNINGYIRTIESIQWSWQNVRVNAKTGCTFGLILGLIISLVAGLAIGLSSELSDTLFGGLPGGVAGGLLGGLLIGMILSPISCLIVGLISGLIGGFQPGVEELKTRPNQGIRLTLRSAVKIGLISGLMIGILAWLLSQNIAFGLTYGSNIFLIIGGWYGGLDVIEHGIVRHILARWGHTPLNYAHFLDYAAQELNFLQKVGGGYIFIHRYLLEHFAEIAVEKGYVQVAVSTSVIQAATTVTAETMSPSIETPEKQR